MKEALKFIMLWCIVERNDINVNIVKKLTTFVVIYLNIPTIVIQTMKLKYLSAINVTTKQGINPTCKNIKI